MTGYVTTSRFTNRHKNTQLASESRNNDRTTTTTTTTTIHSDKVLQSSRELDNDLFVAAGELLVSVSTLRFGNQLDYASYWMDVRPRLCLPRYISSHSM
mmetsp:Transcript_8570/g.13262  ORF Transcript_8570/g.13262 Transcript_8570/m.13262 type:complete len:99 (-) Transcript_8570:93-389(-)